MAPRGSRLFATSCGRTHSAAGSTGTRRRSALPAWLGDGQHLARVERPESATSSRLHRLRTTTREPGGRGCRRTSRPAGARSGASRSTTAARSRRDTGLYTSLPRICTLNVRRFPVAPGRATPQQLDDQPRQDPRRSSSPSTTSTTGSRRRRLLRAAHATSSRTPWRRRDRRRSVPAQTSTGNRSATRASRRSRAAAASRDKTRIRT